MEYGILVVESEVSGEYQIIGPVDSPDEAREIVKGYLWNGPDSGCLAPGTFVIHRRGQWGWYTIRETLEV